MSHVQSVACVVGCSDPRLRKALQEWINQRFGPEALVDQVIWPGATKDVQAVAGQVVLLHSLHNYPILILIHHEDCGAYGGDAGCPVSGHVGILRQQQDLFEQALPGVEVWLLIQYLDGTIIPV